MSAPICTRTISPADARNIREILEALPASAVLCLQPGTYAMRPWIEKSITLRSLSGPVVIEGNGAGTVLVVEGEDVEATFEGVTFRNGFGGAGGQGGNVHVGRVRKVVLRDVVLEDGSADEMGGGALRVQRGEVLLERCMVRKNSGNHAQAILVSGGRVTLRDTFVVENSTSLEIGGSSPAIGVAPNGALVLERSTIMANGGVAIAAHGSLWEAPEITIVSSILGDPPFPDVSPSRSKSPIIRISESALTKPAPAATDGGHNVIGEIRLDAEFRPVAGSIAAGKGPAAR